MSNCFPVKAPALFSRPQLPPRPQAADPGAWGLSPRNPAGNLIRAHRPRGRREGRAGEGRSVRAYAAWPPPRRPGRLGPWAVGRTGAGRNSGQCRQEIRNSRFSPGQSKGAGGGAGPGVLSLGEDGEAHDLAGELLPEAAGVSSGMAERELAGRGRAGIRVRG